MEAGVVVVVRGSLFTSSFVFSPLFSFFSSLFLFSKNVSKTKWYESPLEFDPLELTLIAETDRPVHKEKHSTTVGRLHVCSILCIYAVFCCFEQDYLCKALVTVRLCSYAGRKFHSTQILLIIC